MPKIPRPKVKRLQFERALRIVARLMLRNSGYYTISPEVTEELALELCDLIGVQAEFVSRETPEATE